MDERTVSRGFNVSPNYTGGDFFFEREGNITRELPPVEPMSRARSRQYSEGRRSRSTRITVSLRYFAYFLTAFLCSLGTHAFLSAAGTTSYGGGLMWFSLTLMFATAAVATVAFPTQRMDIIGQMRHYVFGLTAFPGLAIAGVIWALRGVVTSPAASTDTLASLISFAVPAVFVVTVVLPPVVFIKAVAGYHTLNRSNTDDATTLAIFARQDGLHR